MPGRRLAAVLLPLYRHNGDYGVIFTKRSETVPHHQGQMSFPGGGYEAHDGTLRQTALRECQEEIGLQAAHVRVLGQLDDLLTSNSNYLVRPFVGTIPYPLPVHCGSARDRLDCRSAAAFPAPAQPARAGTPRFWGA